MNTTEHASAPDDADVTTEQATEQATPAEIMVIDADLLRAAAVCVAGKNEAKRRPILTGVLVVVDCDTRHTREYVATDTYRMVDIADTRHAVDAATAGAAEYLLPAEIVAACAKMSGNADGSAPVKITRTPKDDSGGWQYNWTIEQAGTRVDKIVETPGEYPQWRQLIDRGVRPTWPVEGVTRGFDPQLLTSFAKVVTAAGKSERGVSVYPLHLEGLVQAGNALALYAEGVRWVMRAMLMSRRETPARPMAWWRPAKSDDTTEDDGES